MKMVIDLNLNDIKNIIAKHFEVDPVCIHVEMNEFSADDILNHGMDFIRVYDQKPVFSENESRAKKLEKRIKKREKKKKMIKQAIKSCGFIEFDDGRREDVILCKQGNQTPQDPMIIVTAAGDQYACSVEKVSREGMMVKEPVVKKFSKEKNEYVEVSYVRRVRIDYK